MEPKLGADLNEIVSYKTHYLHGHYYTIVFVQYFVPSYLSSLNLFDHFSLSFY